MELLPPSVELLADVQAGVMARSLAIALVIVAPFGVAFWRRRAARRRARDSAVAPPVAATPTRPSLESVIERISRLAGGSPASGPGGPDRGDEPRADGSVTITVPHGLTIDGVDAPAEVVDAIVRDALARSGLVPTAELDTGDARVIECRPRAGNPSPSN